MEHEPDKAPTRQERRQLEMEKRILKISELRGNEYYDEPIGYVYRETMGAKKTALPPVREFMEDHPLGLLYGPGNYLVVYKFDDPLKEEGDKERTVSLTYSIGPEYAMLHREYCAQNGLPCWLDARAIIPGFSSKTEQIETGVGSFFTKEKIESFAALLMMLKSVLGNGDKDSHLRDMLDSQQKLLQSVLSARSGGQANLLPESIVSTAFNRLLSPPEQPSAAKIMKEQMELFSTIDSIRNPAAAAARQEQDEVKMRPWYEKLIEQGMEMLPAFLAKNNNDERTAAAALKSEVPLTSVLLNNKNAATAFYNAVAGQYGQDAADKWVQGLGKNPNDFRPAPARPAQPAQARPAATQSGTIFE